VTILHAEPARPRLIVLSAYAGPAYPIRPNGHASTSQRETSSRSVTGRRRPEIASRDHRLDDARERARPGHRHLGVGWSSICLSRALTWSTIALTSGPLSISLPRSTARHRNPQPAQPLAWVPLRLRVITTGARWTSWRARLGCIECDRGGSASVLADRRLARRPERASERARKRRPLPRKAAAFWSIGLSRAHRSVAWNAALTSSPLLSADAGARRAGIARRVLLLIVEAVA
jgi:hypothetical protein